MSEIRELIDYIKERDKKAEKRRKKYEKYYFISFALVISLLFIFYLFRVI